MAVILSHPDATVRCVLTEIRTERLYDAWLAQWAEYGFGYLAVSTLDDPDKVVGFGGEPSLHLRR